VYLRQAAAEVSARWRAGTPDRYGATAGSIVTGPPGGQQALPRVVVGHRRHDGAAEVFASAFVADEVEEPVRANRTADGAAELVAREVGLAVDVEVVRASSASLRWNSNRLPRTGWCPTW
jgi:hypothetical protein